MYKRLKSNDKSWTEAAWVASDFNLSEVTDVYVFKFGSITTGYLLLECNKHTTIVGAKLIVKSKLLVPFLITDLKKFSDNISEHLLIWIRQSNVILNLILNRANFSKVVTLTDYVMTNENFEDVLVFESSV